MHDAEQGRQSLRQKVRELEAEVDEESSQRETYRLQLEKREAELRNVEGVIEAQAKTIRDLEEKIRVIDAERDKAATDSRIAWESHTREKAARESWVQAYRDTLTRAEKAEQALDAAMAAVRENAEGMDACVTAGPQCHYELPYAACKVLLAVLKSDAPRHVHTYAPDTGVCSCGHDEKDDSR
jgi:Tfp pilus assembly protein FimV